MSDSCEGRFDNQTSKNAHKYCTYASLSLSRSQAMTIDDRPTSFSWPSAIIWLIILIHICSSSSMCKCECVCAIKVVTFLYGNSNALYSWYRICHSQCAPKWYESEVEKPHCNYIDWRTHTLYIVVLKLFEKNCLLVKKNKNKKYHENVKTCV